MHKPELFNEFLTFEGASDIKNAGDLILAGLLYSPEDKIREDFKSTLGALSKGLKIKEGQKNSH